MEEKQENRGKERIFKTDEMFEQKFIEYLKFCDECERLPNIAGFCAYCGIHRGTFYDQKAFYPDTYAKIQDMLEDSTINNKTVNDTFKIFYMKNKFDYSDKKEIKADVDSKVKIEDYLKKVEGDEY